MNTKKWKIASFAFLLTFSFSINKSQACGGYKLLPLSHHLFQPVAYTDSISVHKVAVPVQAEELKTHRIQVALLLDTSSSMSGLIEQARSQLWQILNQLARTTKNGKTPELQIALYEYGNTARMSGGRQIRKISNFTVDMDLISEQLFALTTSGGEEYCGEVIDFSLRELEWGSTDSDLRMIYIAGNEPFTQGPINPVGVCQQASEKGIAVNTIFCGQISDGERLGWKQGAQHGGGAFMSIQQNEVTQYIETPYDDKINELNGQLNKTYMPFGQQGIQKQRSQTMQDANAAQYSKTNAAERAAFKSSSNYTAHSWDLVDAYKKDKAILKKTKELPKDLQNLSIKEVEARILKATSDRINIQKQIQELDKKRRDFQTQARKKSNKADLQNSILQSVEKVAKQKGYEIKE